MQQHIIRTSFALVGIGALALAGCASTSPDASSSSEDHTVSIALDWSPNTNHTGIYVAQELGYFEDAGLDVEILPYASTPVAQLVSAGEADFGIVGQSDVQTARAAGLDVVSVYSIVQSDTGRLVYLQDRDDIESPADLDGAVFGGFGVPLYTAFMKSTIQGAGGKGEFDEVMLDTGAYEALKNGSIDFTSSVMTWEDVEAEIEGHPYASFRYQDYGVPEQQAIGIASSDAYLEQNHDDADAFVKAVQKGFQYAIDNPDEAADLLIQANEDTLGTATELVHKSTELMASDGFYYAEGVTLGAAVPEYWEALGDYIIEQGFLVDAGGQKITEAPDWSEYYTNEFVE